MFRLRPYLFCELTIALCRLSDDQAFAQKAFRTVVAGQQAENLLDFDDAPAQEEPSGLAATQILPSTPAAANFFSGTSTNPLDDLVSIFGGMGTVDAGAGGVRSGDGGLGLGGLGAASPPLASASPLDSLALPSSTGQKPQEDLLGLF